MQYSPKLKKAAEQIKAILKEHDIAGVVILHTPGHSEYLYQISPSYSIAKIEGNELRLRSTHITDMEEKVQKVTDTANMFVCLTDVGDMLHSFNQQALRLMKKHIEIVEQRGGGHTSHEQQNN